MRCCSPRGSSSRAPAGASPSAASRSTAHRITAPTRRSTCPIRTESASSSRRTARASSGPTRAALDAPDLFATIEGEPYAASADAGLRIGHIHLHVGDLESETGFYRDGLGFEITALLEHAAFVSAGGYHHHLAYNLWRGFGVGQAPSGGVVGLRHWTLVTDGEDERAAIATRLDAIDAVVQERADGLFARDGAGIGVLVR